jgi:hypothetical protein
MEFFPFVGEPLRSVHSEAGETAFRILPLVSFCGCPTLTGCASPPHPAAFAG